jgi:hypothetical protein
LNLVHKNENVVGPGRWSGGFWPEEESIDDFLLALHEWRGHKKAHPAGTT